MLYVHSLVIDVQFKEEKEEEKELIIPIKPPSWITKAKERIEKEKKEKKQTEETNNSTNN